MKFYYQNVLPIICENETKMPRKERKYFDGFILKFGYKFFTSLTMSGLGSKALLKKNYFYIVVSVVMSSIQHILITRSVSQKNADCVRNL